jgi:hypothetical protein
VQPHAWSKRARLAAAGREPCRRDEVALRSIGITLINTIVSIKYMRPRTDRAWIDADRRFPAS